MAKKQSQNKGNQNTGGSNQSDDSTEKEPVLDRIWAFTKDVGEGALAGAAGYGIARGVGALWTRGAKRTTEEAARGAVNGGSSYKPF